MSETPIHAKSAKYVLGAIAVFVLGISTIWFIGWYPNEDTADWSTIPDVGKPFAPTITGHVDGADTTYRVSPPEGFLDDAADTLTLSLDANALKLPASGYIPPELLNAIADSLARGGIVTLKVYRFQNGLIFVPEPWEDE